MNRLISISFIILFLGCNNPQTDNFKSIVKQSQSQYKYALERINQKRSEKLFYPRTLVNGELKLVASSDWTSGFFPGSLWMMYELTGDENWKEKALAFTLPLESGKWNCTTHDTGFIMYCSFGHAIKHCDSPEYKEILIQSAKTLATRYNPIVKCIRSWDSNSKTSQWKYPVIIDNMMNLELLLWAAKETGNESFKEIAVRHAETTLENHFRADYSCYHVVDYDPSTGEVLQKNTHQGFADESAWARGQAWALYGFTMMYRETRKSEFLDQAQHIANYLINKDGMEEGHIPHWDFDAPNLLEQPYDASAGAVISSALFDLYAYTKNERYRDVAKKLLRTLSTPEFLSKVGENEGFLLKHSTGSKPFDSEVDAPLVYADYYYLESLIKYKEYGENLVVANKNELKN